MTQGMALHYSLFGVYVGLFALTVWSFLAACCSDPGYVPKDLQHYDKENLPNRELLLWTYLERIGINPMTGEFAVSASPPIGGQGTELGVDLSTSSHAIQIVQ